MGKLAILLVAAMSVVAIQTMISTKGNLFHSDARLSEAELEVLVRSSALAGEAIAAQELVNHFGSQTFEGRYEGVAYVATATVSGNTVTIESRAAATSPKGKELTYSVESMYDRVLTSGGEYLPPFMRYAVVTEGDLTLKGTISSDVYAQGYEDNVLNTDMHTNGVLSLSGGGADKIRGHGTFVGGVSGKEDHLTKKFDPYYFKDESENNSIYQTERVEIDPLAMSYDPEAQHLVINNAITVPLTAAFSSPDTEYFSFHPDMVANHSGTREYPAIYYVDGSLTFTQDVEIPPYTLFLVRDGIDFNNKTVTAGASNYDGGDESTLAFYAGGGIEIQGNARVWAQLYSLSGASVGSGSPHIYGNLSSRGTATLNGTLDVKYREASPALTMIWDETATTKLRRLSYAEF